MFLHHLKTSWRNLLKYKVQNAISILCLAAGVVCFAITVYFMYGFGRSVYYNQIKQDLASFSVLATPYEETQRLRKTGSFPPNAQLDNDFFNRLLNLKLPAMDGLHGYVPITGLDQTFYDNTEQPKTCGCYYTHSSPRYWMYYGYRSAITGEPLTELEENDCLITDDLSAQLFGEDTDPRGFEFAMGDGTGKRPIRDVIKVTDRLEAHATNAVVIIRNDPETAVENRNGFTAELAEGYTAEDLREQLQSAFPEYTFLFHITALDNDELFLIILIIGVVLSLGASVLIIGVMGFLKMELQLFSLRSREMALRRAMGARTRHLFMLLAWEVVIVFALTMLATVALTYSLADYALPILQRFHKQLNFDVDFVLNLELWITLSTLLLALIAAFATVYRQLRIPVGMRVGRSHRTMTRGQGFMLTTQLTVSMFLTFAVLGMMYVFGFIEKQESGGISEDRTPYQKAIMIPQPTFQIAIPDFPNRLAQNRDVEHVGYSIFSSCEVAADQLDRTLVRNYFRTYSNDGIVQGYGYNFLSTSENLIDLLKIEITPNLPADSTMHGFYNAIYVRTEQAERLRKKWNLDVSRDVQVRPLYKQRSYTLIGYAPALPGYRHGSYTCPSFWMVDEDIDWRDLRNFSELHSHSSNPHYILFPKEGKYNKVKDDITELYREARPGDRNILPIHNLADEWFNLMRMIEMMRQLCLMLVIVSILCIVASVYSAIALESRGRQKEVALRKIHGAHTRDIILLFGKYYLRLLGISAVIVFVVSSAVIATILVVDGDVGLSKDLPWLFFYLILAILIV
ncbi:MAG: ABC transporter permease, partial [Bacteroidaceae bacterium]|nr:ABC transporter permease [Bacteroidaceae bacterium]